MNMCKEPSVVLQHHLTFYLQLTTEHQNLIVTFLLSL